MIFSFLTKNVHTWTLVLAPGVELTPLHYFKKKKIKKK